MRSAAKAFKASIRQISFTLTSQFNFVLKVSSLAAAVSQADFVIRYPESPLADIVKARHPQTAILSSDVSISEFIVDMSVDKLVQLTRLVEGIKSTLKQQADTSASELDVSVDGLTESVNHDNLPMGNGRFASFRYLSEQVPRYSSHDIHGKSNKTISRAGSSPYLASGPPDSIEKLRFALNLLLNFRLEKLVLLNELKDQAKSLRYSLASFSVKASRFTFAVSFKNLILDLVNDGKTESPSQQSEELLLLPCVISTDRSDFPVRV